MLNNLYKRIITAGIIYPIILYIVLYSNEVVIRLFLNIIIFLSAFEISKICISNDKSKSFSFIAVVFILIFFSNILIKNDIWQYYIIIVSIIWLLIFYHLYSVRKINKISHFSSVYLLVIAIILCGLYCALYVLYKISPTNLVYIISLVALCDISAYFIGKKFGKTPFFHTISPNKTKEGFVGALIVCIIFSSIFWFFQDSNSQSFLANLLYCILIVCLSVLGDLSVSILKRYTNKKDMGTILPGHGGILDRLDSLLPVAPIILILTNFF